jgi:hypothetical protein
MSYYEGETSVGETALRAAVALSRLEVAAGLGGGGAAALARVPVALAPVPLTGGPVGWALIWGPSHPSRRWSSARHTARWCDAPYRTADSSSTLPLRFPALRASSKVSALHLSARNGTRASGYTRRARLKCECDTTNGGSQHGGSGARANARRCGATLPGLQSLARRSRYIFPPTERKAKLKGLGSGGEVQWGGEGEEEGRGEKGKRRTAAHAPCDLGERDLDAGVRMEGARDLGERDCDANLTRE